MFVKLILVENRRRQIETLETPDGRIQVLM
jgi:hypothetical protein